ncbi:bifunctional DNA-formamidopyrimidine glycosylase/DNA-(apurinic or apyrimidinic site) lyase [Candidatus Saccharibacteria bacterium]|jgi:formamidopyrimidine-DNA glycosylase|nr:bifunctional DNA-formamidopyrimidine glycosylase/DNA-(apurinic or apyrimidinic site) lyase [Candidatus Saccharibacteria bacterium]HOR23082.1 bifunctional DNA-formamidopyrimidine glycosylase/DNA-(apurinic or apyrimidinic site) lyase [Candidatus Saccharibacteria bacterium]HPW47776.1 bifunctional DNA-formamidopyrimidine glycosylase/DNA-(apurinic or apyrimidinic site) lyase [Candidatus Saccharibacteria bacterium]
MPELPEVETVKLGLRQFMPGLVISKTKSDWPKSFPNSPSDVKKFMIGSEVLDIRRRAKVLMIDLSSGYSLVIHLKMTGQLVFRGKQSFGAGHPTDSLIGELPDKSTRVTVEFTNGSKLFFNDQRKFGWMRLIPTDEIPNIGFMQKVGPEPLGSSFSLPLFTDCLMKRKNSNIKTALLDQSVIAGIGNIYADESLFCAGIHPSSIVSAIPKARLKRLHDCLIRVLKLSIEKGGSTDKNYVNAEGKKGSYIEFAKVFRKEHQPCPKCGREIIKIRVAGRGTHVCIKDQKLYEK